MPFLIRICVEIGACDPLRKSILRELTCEDCELNMDEVRTVLVNGNRIQGR
jgi:hypothetical protein